MPPPPLGWEEESQRKVYSHLCGLASEWMKSSNKHGAGDQYLRLSYLVNNYCIGMM
jgi:hypothetical protein